MDGGLSGAGDKIVVIGYGNSLRTDDGVGPYVATSVASWGVPELVSVAVHQLTPELAELLASATLAIFVDARLTSGGENVEILPLELSIDHRIHGHVCDPRSLLALALALHGRTPQSWLATIPAANFSVGEGLSITARRGVQQALDSIAALLGASLRAPDGASPFPRVLEIRTTTDSAIRPNIGHFSPIPTTRSTCGKVFWA
jgi:hydrogenase maturation protease